MHGLSELQGCVCARIYDSCAYSTVSVVMCCQIEYEAPETVLQYLEEQPEVSVSAMVLLNGLLMKTTARRAKSWI